VTDEEKDEKKDALDGTSSDDDGADGAAEDEAPEEEAPAKSEPPPKKKSASALDPVKKAGAVKKAGPTKKSAPPEPEKKRTLAYVGLAIVAIGALTAYQTSNANAEARARVEAACRKLRPLEEKKLAAMKEAAHTFMGDDAAAVESTIDAARIAPVCDKLPAELTGMKWNFGKRWEPPKDPNAKPPPTAEELHDIMLRAKPRCEAKVVSMLGMLESLGDDPVPEETKQSAMSICDPETFRQEVAPDGPKPDWPPTLLEGWPRYLEGYATALSQVDAASSAATAPAPPP
jgi:hypothetical protein